MAAIELNCGIVSQHPTDNIAATPKFYITSLISCDIFLTHYTCLFVYQIFYDRSGKVGCI